jgi:hypothetical protein
MFSSTSKTIGILIFFIGVGAYFLLKNYFATGEISNFSGYVSLLIAIVALLGGFYTDAKNKKKENLLFSPEITWTLSEPAFEMADRFLDSVKVVNTSTSPALNIVMRYRLDRNENYTSWITCFTLQGHQINEIFWLRYPDTIQAVYHDRSGEKYFRSTMQDSATIKEEIPSDEYRDIAAEGMANRNHNNSILRVSFINFLNSKLILYNNDMDRALQDFNEFYIINLR